jgi:hypothetical protein
LIVIPGPILKYRYSASDRWKGKCLWNKTVGDYRLSKQAMRKVRNQWSENKCPRKKRFGSMSNKFFAVSNPQKWKGKKNEKVNYNLFSGNNDFGSKWYSTGRPLGDGG